MKNFGKRIISGLLIVFMCGLSLPYDTLAVHASENDIFEEQGIIDNSAVDEDETVGEEMSDSDTQEDELVVPEPEQIIEDEKNISEDELDKTGHSGYYYYKPYNGADYSLKYVIEEDNTICIKGVEGVDPDVDLGRLVIPNSINLYKVTVIEDSAFSEYSGFYGDLTIPDNVKRIGRSAFSGCTGLDGKLYIGNSVEIIGEGAFENCSNLSGDLILPNSIKEIESRAFRNCSGLNGKLRLI